jgi:zinc protease
VNASILRFAQASFAAAALVVGVGCGSARIVTPLRYGEAPRAIDEPFRAAAPTSSPVPLSLKLPWESEVLPNGMRIVLFERHDLPVVGARLLFTRGTADAGVPLPASVLLARWLTRGTETKTADELDSAWGKIGAEHGKNFGHDATELFARAPSEGFDTAVALLADTVMHPRLDEADFPRSRAEALAVLESGAGGIEAGKVVVVQNLLFGRAHPYGFSKTLRTIVDDLRPNDVRALHAKLFHPANATLIVAGDVTFDRLRATANAVFGSWAPSESPLTRATLPRPDSSGPHTVLVDMPNRSHVGLAVYVPMPHLEPEELAAATILAQCLGGTSSELTRGVRDKEGAAYIFNARIDEKRLGPVITIGGSVEPEKAEATLKRMMDTLQRVVSSGVNAEEVDRARGSVLASLRGQASTNMGITGFAADAVEEGLPLEKMMRLATFVGSARVEDVNRVAKKYLTVDAIRMELAGDLRRLDDVRGFAPVERWTTTGEMAPARR